MKTDISSFKIALLTGCLPLCFLVIVTASLSTRHASSSPRTTSVYESPISDTARAHSAFDFVNSIGVNTHLNYFDRTYGNFAFVEKELRSIGIRHLRDGVHLQNKDYNDMLYDRWMQLGKLGIRFDAVLDPRSKLGTITPELLAQVDDLSGHTIESFEGPNEMDISGASGWASTDRDFQRTIFTAVKSLPAANRIAVIGPSLAFASHGSEFDGKMDMADKGNLHSYPAGKMPSAVFPEQTDLARSIFGSKPIFMTESGYHNALHDHHDQPAVSEQAAAKYVPRLFLEDFARGIPRTYLYEFLDEAPDPGLSDNQLHWGLIRADGTEKPAFTAVKRLVAELNDGTEPAHLRSLAWSLSPADKSIHHLLLQKSSGEFDLILWREVSSYDIRSQTEIDNPPLTAVLTLGQKAQLITLYEPVMQDAPIKTARDVASMNLAVPDHPLVIAIAPR